MGSTFYRSTGIKLGYAQTVVGFLCFVIGIASPAWSESASSERVWHGPWWYCKLGTDQTSPPVTCSVLQITGIPPGDVLALLILSALSTFMYVVTFSLGTVLICCRRSPGNAGKWKLVSVLEMIAGMTGLGSVIVFSMSTTTNVFMFGFYLTMAGSCLALTGGFTFAWSQLRYWRLSLGAPVSAADWDALPPPYPRHRQPHPNSVATWESGYEFPYSGHKIGTHAGTAQWVAHHS